MGRLVVITADTVFFDSFSAVVSEPVTRLSYLDGEQPSTVGALVDRLESIDPDVVAVAPDVPETLALALARELDVLGAPAGVMLVRTPTPELWREGARAGVRDIVAPDVSPAEMRVAIEATATRSTAVRATRPPTAAQQPGGRMLVVLSPKGGSGKTMVSSNLAVALAQASRSEVVLVDLDTVFGDVASVLGMVPDRTIGQLSMVPQFDSTTLKVFLTRHPESGLNVLPGSGSPEEGEAVTPEVATEVLRMLVQDFPYTVVDTAAGLDERTLAAIEMATDLVFVASLDVASIRNLGKEIDALDRLGLRGARRHFILNRADARVGLEVADVESAIGMHTSAALPSSRSVPLSMNQGRPVVLEEPASPVSVQLLQFTASLLPQSEQEAAAERRSRFFRRRP